MIYWNNCLNYILERKGNMKIKISDHFTFKKLFCFTLPSIIMMVFTSIYGVVDGFFVSNYAGKTEFAAVNLIMPFLMILGSIGFMFGTGGSALISKTIGEEKLEKAQRIFSLLVYTALIIGIVIAVLGIVFLKPIAILLGADGDMLGYCVTYGRIILSALPAFILQYAFQSFFVAAGKPQLGLYVTIAAGATNMILDWLLVGVFSFGIVGAAFATASSEAIGGIVPLIYFMRKNTSYLRLRRTKFMGKAIVKACTNGSSELMSNISMSIVSMLYNMQLMKYAGEDGVAAYGVLMYVNFVFLAVFIGYSVGTSSVIGFNYGAQNHREIQGILKKSTVIISIFAVCMLLLAQIFAKSIANIFVGYDSGLMDLTLHAFRISSFAFLFAGFAIYGSAFFTALNNGLISALISFLRTLVFQVAAVIIFPIILGINGIWISIVAAEIVAALVTVIFIFAMRKKYHYL